MPPPQSIGVPARSVEYRELDGKRLARELSVAEGQINARYELSESRL